MEMHLVEKKVEKKRRFVENESLKRDFLSGQGWLRLE